MRIYRDDLSTPRRSGQVVRACRRRGAWHLDQVRLQLVSHRARFGRIGSRSYGQKLVVGGHAGEFRVAASDWPNLEKFKDQDGR